MHDDSFLANGNYHCSWCTNGIETSFDKWMDHVYSKHRPQWRTILNAQREKKRIQTQRRLDAEKVLDDAIKKMDEVIQLEQVRSEIILLCL
jgi:hypothetical protein